MNFDLKDKVAIVTRGAMGIGAAAARSWRRKERLLPSSISIATWAQPLPQSVPIDRTPGKQTKSIPAFKYSSTAELGTGFNAQPD
jgi:hypothetical protein